MVVVPLADLHGIMTESEASTLLQQFFTECQEPACRNPVPLEALILEEQHQALQDMRASCEKLPIVVCSQSEGSRRNKHPWVEQHWKFATKASDKRSRSRHLRATRSDPWECGIPDAQLQTLFPALRLLQPREFDLLHHKFHVSCISQRRL